MPATLATAMNRVGARLMVIPTELAGDLSFALAALIGVRSRASMLSVPTASAPSADSVISSSSRCGGTPWRARAASTNSV